MGFCQSQCRAVREIDGDVTTKRKNPSLNGFSEVLLHSSSDVKIQHYHETIDVGTEKKVCETPEFFQPSSRPRDFRVWMETDFVSEEKFLRVDQENYPELKMHFVRDSNPGGQKKKQQIVFLHGELSCCYSFRKIVPQLLDDFEVFIPDLIGYGKSTKVADDSIVTYENHVKWLKFFFQALKLKNVILFANGFGGQIALRVVADMPECFSGLILCNTALFDGVHQTLPTIVTEKYDDELIQSLKISDGVKKLLHKKMLIAEELESYDAPFPDPIWENVVRNVFSSMPHKDSPTEQINAKKWENLKSFTNPCLIITGVNDPLYAPQSEAFIDNIPGCNLCEHVPLQNVGQFVHEEIWNVITRQIYNMRRIIGQKMKEEIKRKINVSNLTDAISSEKKMEAEIVVNVQPDLKLKEKIMTNEKINAEVDALKENKEENDEETID